MESEERTEALHLPGPLNHLPDEVLMPPVDAVEDADGEENILLGSEGGQVMNDSHRCLLALSGEDLSGLP